MHRHSTRVVTITAMLLCHPAAGAFGAATNGALSPGSHQATIPPNADDPAGSDDSAPDAGIETADPAPAHGRTPQASDPLRVGDVAPPLRIAEILKGDTGFRTFPEGRVTVVEFWATWCGPCKAGMPHLSDLQRRYREDGLTVIGITRESREVVEAFLARPEWAAKTRYTMALDEDSETNAAYMKAAGRTGIPCAFVVDGHGRVAWIGHPSRIDAPLARIVAGDWNLADARDRIERERSTGRILAEARTRMRERGGDAAIATTMELVDRGLAISPDHPELLDLKFRLLAGPLGDPDAYVLGRRILEEHGNRAMILNSLAWYVMTDPSVGDRDIEFALAAANAANEAAKGKFPPIYEVLARAHFESGDLDAAIRYQRMGVEKAEGRMAEHLSKALERYLELDAEARE